MTRSTSGEDTAREWHIRPAVESDDAELLALESDVEISGTAHFARYRARSFFGRSRLYERPRTLVAVCDGRIFAFVDGAIKRISLGGHEHDVGHGFNLRVDPAYWRMGVGRTLLTALYAWFDAEGVVGRYCMIDEQNEASRRMHIVTGYRDLVRTAYLNAYPPRNIAPDAAILVNLAADSEWAARILGPNVRRDFCPTNAASVLYTTRVTGGYLGTLVTTVGGEMSWLSVWDKDLAIGRDPVAPSYRRLFIYDLRLMNADAWEILITAVFRRWPFIALATVFVDAADIERFGKNHAPILDRIETLMAYLPESLIPSDRPYLDIRD